MGWGQFFGQYLRLGVIQTFRISAVPNKVVASHPFLVKHHDDETSEPELDTPTFNPTYSPTFVPRYSFSLKGLFSSYCVVTIPSLLWLPRLWPLPAAPALFRQAPVPMPSWWDLCRLLSLSSLYGC